MVLKATKGLGLAILGLGVLVFFLPKILILTSLDQVVPFVPGEARFSSAFSLIFSCWGGGVALGLVGAWGLVFWPLKSSEVPVRCQR